jgi:hypothetical protein
MSHINNLSNFIKPVDTMNKVENSLKGVVTPFNQTYHKSEDSMGFDIIEIIDDEKMLSRFDRYTFPHIEKTSDGTLFITPTKRVLTSTENYYVKWLVLNEEFQPLSNHNYPMLPLPKNGYLMKIVLHVTSDNPTEFIIQYVVDYHNIGIQTVSGVNGISQVQSSFSGQSSIEVDKADSISVKTIDISRIPQIMSMINDKESFFKEYLQDMIDN